MGGRVATRWKGTREDIQGRWDHGAQFVTFRSEALIAKLKQWNAWDVLEPWIPSYSDASMMRYRPKQGMNAFAKALADGLHIETSQRVSHLCHENGEWLAHTESGDSFRAAQVISTIPMPQFLDLIEASTWDLPAAETDLLHQVDYERCLSLLAEADRPVTLESEGYARVNTGVLDTVIHHQQKGISSSPTLTAHATPAFSMEWYDRDRDTAASVMRAALQEFLQTPLISVQIHGWKFAKAIQRIPHPFLRLHNGCLLAGDGFQAGDETAPSSLHPRIESAMLSGLSAAESL